MKYSIANNKINNLTLNINTRVVYTKNCAEKGKTVIDYQFLCFLMVWLELPEILGYESPFEIIGTKVLTRMKFMTILCFLE